MEDKGMKKRMKLILGVQNFPIICFGFFLLIYEVSKSVNKIK